MVLNFGAKFYKTILVLIGFANKSRWVHNVNEQWWVRRTNEMFSQENIKWNGMFTLVNIEHKPVESVAEPVEAVAEPVEAPFSIFKHGL